MATEKQKKAVVNILENPCLKEALLKSGYKPNTAHNPKDVTESKWFKELTEPLVKQLEEKRQEALDNLTDKLDKASYNDLTSAIDKFTKTIELLSGRETERAGITINTINYGDNSSLQV